MYTPIDDSICALLDDEQYVASCGHAEAIPGHVDPNDHANCVAHHSEVRLCRDCWISQQNRALDDFDRELPALRGSDKQIAWARSVRRDMISDLQARIALAEDLGKKTAVKKLMKTLDGIRGVTDSNLWIDARYVTAEAFYADLVRMMRATYFRRIKART